MKLIYPKKFTIPDNQYIKRETIDDFTRETILTVQACKFTGTFHVIYSKLKYVHYTNSSYKYKNGKLIETKEIL